jgi:hypothetical protein
MGTLAAIAANPTAAQILAFVAAALFVLAVLGALFRPTMRPAELVATGLALVAIALAFTV